MAPHKLKTTQ